MAVLLENRTISMILMVPEVDVTSSSSTPIIETLDRSDSDAISSMPVYQGSIVRIEQHSDDRNISDLIIRVPNFQHASSPTTDTDGKSSTRIKRRAPICPALYGPDPHLSTTNNTRDLDSSNLSQTRVISTSRLTTGLRSLSRAFTYGCKSRRTSSISEETAPSALPDVEVMTEKLEVPKHSLAKLVPPKILLVKRKHSKIKKKQPAVSSVSNDTQTEVENNRINSTPTPTIGTTQHAEVEKNTTPKVTSFLHRFIEEDPFNEDTNNKEQQNESIRLSFDVEQHFAAFSQLVDAESLSTHRYSTISANVPDIRISMIDYDREDASSPEGPSIGLSYDLNPKPASLSPRMNRPFRVQTSMLQPDISVIRVGTSDLITATDRRLPGEKEFVDPTANIEQEQNDAISVAECYEVTYQIESGQQNEKEEHPDQSSVSPKITIDPFEYKNLASSVTIGESPVIPNEYEQIEHLATTPQEQNHRDTPHKSCSIEDLSRTSDDQTSTYQLDSIAGSSSSSDISSRHCTLQRSNSYDGFGIHVSTDTDTRREHFIGQVEELSPGEQAGLKDNDRILCINGTPVVQEDYTVVLQLIKHGLQTDTLDFDVMAHEAYEQFKSEIDQLSQ